MKLKQKLTTKQRLKETRLKDRIKKVKEKIRTIKLITGIGQPVILSEEEKGLRKQAYNVLVREGEKRGDRFKRVASGLPRNKALRLGSKIVDNFIEASFRIQRTKKLAKIRDDLATPILRKFRLPVPGSKLPRDTIIEMARFRLDTANEVKQLAFFKELKAKRQSALSILRAARTQQVNIIATQKKQQQIDVIKASKGGSSLL